MNFTEMSVYKGSSGQWSPSQPIENNEPATNSNQSTSLNTNYMNASAGSELSKKPINESRKQNVRRDTRQNIYI